MINALHLFVCWLGKKFFAGYGYPEPKIIFEKFEPLTRKEFEKLQNRHWGFLFWIAPFVFICVSIYSVIPLILLFLAILLCIIYHYLVFVGDMNLKIKKIIVFKLTKKELAKNVDDMYNFFDNEIIYSIENNYINHNIYNTLKIGDFVAISMLPRNKTIFNIEKIENPSDNNPN